MIELVYEASRAGPLTARSANKYLHSRYDPQKEAQKYLEGRDFSATIICILLCPGLGFLETAILVKNPNLRLLIINPVQNLNTANKNLDTAQQVRWCPQNSIPLVEFLNLQINDCDATMTELVLWPPAHSIFTDFCEQNARIIESFLKTANANFLTQAYFGKRWLSNAFQNSSIFEFTPKITIPDAPVFLAASGPGLNQILPFLKEYRNRFFICALPSSIQALASAKICPDMLVTSDAGYWAGRHLSLIPQEWFESGNFFIFCPLRAQLRSLAGVRPRLVLHSSGELADSLLIQDRACSVIPIIPDCGTVAATAIELLIYYKVKKVLIAGLDFANYDMQSHVQPHSFDYQIYEQSLRLTPSHDLLFKRQGESRILNTNRPWRTSHNLDIYRAWFETQNFQQDIVVLDYNPSQVEKGLVNCDLNSFQETITQLPIVTQALFSRIEPNNEVNVIDHHRERLKSSHQKISDILFQDLIFDDSNQYNLYCQIAPFAYRDWRKFFTLKDYLGMELALVKIKQQSSLFIKRLLRFIPDGR